MRVYRILTDDYKNSQRTYTVNIIKIVDKP